jgi:hypothetical protein
MSFAPKFDILPEVQRALWPSLREVPRNFVLYGGTALALRLGHRTSIDFDFFSTEPFDPAELRRSLPMLKEARPLQIAKDTLTMGVGPRFEVDVSFFGGLDNLGRVGEPELTDDGVISVASLADVAACKAAVICERAQAKDYKDIYALLRSGFTLEQIIGAAQAVYGEQYNAIMTLKALDYFRDGDLGTLPEEVKKTLARAAMKLGSIPVMARLPGGLQPG